MSNLLLLLGVLCLGLLLRHGMARLRVPIDGFILALVFVLLAATLLPCQGEAARCFGLLGNCAIGALFFLQGARLSRQTVLNGATHWRLHLFVGATTFLVFPLLGLGMVAVFPHLLPSSLWLGVLFVCALPSTVQSSIALTSMARGNVSAAICAATLSNVAGVALAPLLFGAMSHLHGGGIDAGAVLQVGMQLLLPFLAGHLSRPWLSTWAEGNRKLLSITDRGSILLIVYTAFSAAVLRGIWQSLPPATLCVLGLVMVVMLASVLATVVSIGRVLGFDRADEVALLFCGSQKSLVSGVPIANALASGAMIGPLLLPIMLYHPIQLLVCTGIARCYLRGGQRPKGDVEVTTGRAVGRLQMIRQMSVSGRALAILAALVAGGSATRAGTLPAGTGFVQCATATGYITDPVSCNGGTDSGLVTYAPFASVSAYAYGEGLVSVAGTFGVLNYNFEVTGGNPGDVVPVDIDTVLQAIPISIGYAFSEIGVTANTSADVTICSSGCGAGDAVTGFTGTLQVDALSGAVDTVHLEVEAGGGLGNTSDFDGGMASADPYIFIAPTFPNAADYSIEVSPNIGNVPGPVPEPGSLALLAAGLATLAGLRHRRTHGRHRLNYNFEVTGGHPGDVVPVDVDAVLQAIPISIGYAFSEIGVTANTSADVTICSSGCGAGNAVTGFTGTLQWMLCPAPSTPYTWRSRRPGPTAILPNLTAVWRVPTRIF